MITIELPDSYITELIKLANTPENLALHEDKEDFFDYIEEYDAEDIYWMGDKDNSIFQAREILTYAGIDWEENNEYQLQSTSDIDHPPNSSVPESVE